MVDTNPYHSSWTSGMEVLVGEVGVCVSVDPRADTVDLDFDPVRFLGFTNWTIPCSVLVEYEDPVPDTTPIPCACDILVGPCVCGAFVREQLRKGMTWNPVLKSWEIR